MKLSLPASHRTRLPFSTTNGFAGALPFCLILSCVFVAATGLNPAICHAQAGEVPQIEDMTPSDSLPPSTEPAAGDANRTPPAAASGPGDEVIYREKGLNLLNLLARGGWFMVPLGILSIAVVALGIERWLALREEKIMPRHFVRDLGSLSRSEEGFDPRTAFRLCQSYPSAAARVIRVMLLKAGRPQSEIDNAVNEASQREASRSQSVVSWLTLAAAVAPLIGLLGTVWGMIQAFYDTTQLVPGQNKAEVLAQGIYTALVTTLSGLIIAIPSAVLAHYFDNRILAWFHRIEELAASLTPMLEPYEGKVRAGGDLDVDPPVARRKPAPTDATESPAPTGSGGRHSRQTPR